MVTTVPSCRQAAPQDTPTETGESVAGELVSRAEGALLLGVGRSTISGWVSSGRIQPAGHRGRVGLYTTGALRRAQRDARHAMLEGAKKREQLRPPRVVFVPISVAWAFTRERGWHVIEDPTSAINMDRLCELYDEAESRAELMVAGR